MAGSPHKQGNSDTLCDQVLSGASEAGADVEKVYLQDLNIQACIACGACQARNTGRCVLKDDMQSLYPKLERCTTLVIASPIYYLSLNAQTTLFLNRTYPLFNVKGPRLGAKKLIACLTYGDPDPIGSGCDIAARILREVCGYFDISMKLVHASAPEKNSVKRNKSVMTKAFELGRETVVK